MKYLGTALKYPITLVGGCPINVSGIEAIEQSLLDILNTLISSVFFLPEYGSRVEELIFEPNDEVVESLLSVFIEEAIGDWEKRTKFVGVTFERKDAAINCHIVHQIIGLNKLTTTVYTFYRKS
jgi:phage baseplate assembly protein W